MAKIKLHKLHKIKIHHNRWLIWAIVYVVLVWIALLGYIKVSEINQDTQLQADNNFVSWHKYTDQRLGYSVRHPADWSIETASDSTVSFSPNESKDSGVEIYRATLAAEKGVRKPLNIASEKPVMVDGVSGVQINNDLGMGHFESIVLVKNNKKLYVIRGTKNLVDKLLLTFNFIPLDTKTSESGSEN